MELVDRIDAAIETLPELAKEVFILHRFEDLSFARIARRLGITAREVERQLAIALVHLVEAVDESKAQVGREHRRCGRA